jgi:hypothetical protein
MITITSTRFAAGVLGLVLVAMGASAMADPPDNAQAQAQSQPRGAPPTAQPAPPPTDLPPPPQQAQPAPQESTGQWVHTDQYGWLWMPYGDNYVYAPADGSGYPYAYVYEPALGWTWLVAPWIWGWGPRPFFGIYGPGRFHWGSAFGFHAPAEVHVAPRLGGGSVGRGAAGGLHGGGGHRR